MSADTPPTTGPVSGQSSRPVVEGDLIPDEGQPTLEVTPEPDAARLFDPATMGGASIAALTSLLDRYMVPPFTVLDRRQGYWQERARQWKGLGIEGELGRGDNLLKHSDSLRSRFSGNREFGAEERRAAAEDGDNGAAITTSATSIFDPVICEIAYHWFCPPRGLVLDPFAGGSVRGIMAAASGRKYIGIDLSGPQCVANRVQAERIIEDEASRPIWTEGDSHEVLRDYMGAMPDMLFTCPPYGDLEVYSDHPADLSNMTAKEFARIYTEILAEAIGVLRPDSFAAIVVGNYRDKRGMLHDLGGLTVRACNAAGARFYNEGIIIDPVGTAAVRAPRQFDAARKLVRMHQQLLVFIKGDPRKATEKVKG